MVYQTIFDDLYRINRELSSFLAAGRVQKSSAIPEVNLYENESEYRIVAKMPGVKKEDVAITCKDKTIKIAGEKKVEKNEKAQYHLRERREGTFERSVLLADRIDADKIEAQMQNGFLMIKVPKKEEAQPKKIEIN